MKHDESCCMVGVGPDKGPHPDCPGVALFAATRRDCSIEQSRRNFKADHPDLYRYIALREQKKALDSAGDRISGHHEAANVVWALAVKCEQQRRAMLDD